MTLSQRQNRLAVERARVRGLVKPVDRTKSYITISYLLLSLASDAVREDDIDDLNHLMDEYIATIELARDTIVIADIERHSKGYHALEIALRMHGRLLQELRLRLTLEKRATVEAAEFIVTAAHEEMLHLIFPQSTAASTIPRHHVERVPMNFTVDTLDSAVRAETQRQ